MTKQELFIQLASVPADAIITLVMKDHTVCDVDCLAILRKELFALHNTEIQLHPTDGRSGAV